MYVSDGILSYGLFVRFSFIDIFLPSVAGSMKGTSYDRTNMQNWLSFVFIYCKTSETTIEIFFFFLFGCWFLPTTKGNLFLYHTTCNRPLIWGGNNIQISESNLLDITRLFFIFFFFSHIYLHTPHTYISLSFCNFSFIDVWFSSSPMRILILTVSKHKI